MTLTDTYCASMLLRFVHEQNLETFLQQRQPRHPSGADSASVKRFKRGQNYSSAIWAFKISSFKKVFTEIGKKEQPASKGFPSGAMEINLPWRQTYATVLM